MTAALVGLAGLIVGTLLGGFMEYSATSRARRIAARKAGALIAAELADAARRLKPPTEGTPVVPRDLPSAMWLPTLDDERIYLGTAATHAPSVARTEGSSGVTRSTGPRPADAARRQPAALRRPQAERLHARARDWLTKQLNGSRRVGLPWQSLASFLRIAIHPHAVERPPVSHGCVGAGDRLVRYRRRLDPRARRAPHGDLGRARCCPTTCVATWCQTPSSPLWRSSTV